jgi:hypothetical protein
VRDEAFWSAIGSDTARRVLIGAALDRWRRPISPADVNEELGE